TAEPLGALAPAPLPDGTLVYVTLGAHGWELRHGAPVATGRGAPVAFPEPLPFDSAPVVAVRETGYTSWPSLRPHFWIPVYADAGPTGRFYGAFTAGTDALGRFVYGADVYVSGRSEEHTSELQSRGHLVCRLLLEKKKKQMRRV